MKFAAGKIANLNRSNLKVGSGLHSGQNSCAGLQMGPEEFIKKGRIFSYSFEDRRGIDSCIKVNSQRRENVCSLLFLPVVALSFSFPLEGALVSKKSPTQGFCDQRVAFKAGLQVRWSSPVTKC